MQKINQQVLATILSVVILLIAICFVILFLTLRYIKTKGRLLKQQESLQSHFRQELLKTQIEVQEETLANISREIHDNISQVLSFVKLNLALTGDLPEPEKQQKVNESRELVAQAINDLRHLSKSLSFEHIAMLGLVKTIEFETARIHNSGVIEMSLRVEGSEYSLGEQTELVLFRIFQESLNNTLKHAKAKYFNISLQYAEDLFTLTLEDNGVGFSTASLPLNGGAGLKNIKNRAALIGAVAAISSSPGKGCCIKVELNPSKQQYNNGNHQDSTG